MLGYAECSNLTGLAVGTLYSLVYRHQIPHYRLGRRLVRFRRTEIERWLEDRQVLPEQTGLVDRPEERGEC
ncbi:MAG: helix-turn-helix domain-containing protein [Myxococcota bacterium]